MRRILLLLVMGGVCLLATACGSGNSEAPQVAKPPEGAYESGMYARSGSGVGANKDASAKKPGQIVFENQGCTKCHSLTEGGEPGAEGGRGPGGKGPNLAKVGANHDKTWIAEHIRNAKTHKPMSRMPEYPEAKLNEKDLNTLAEYLAGLK